MIEHAYIHIPFCVKKCNYCSFVSTINLKIIPVYIRALNKEINERYKCEKLKTLYFGGGTPSLLSSMQLKNIIKNFIFDDNYEFTIEVNPEKITFDKYKEFIDIGINRISIGIQTFNDYILQKIGRLHSSKQAISAVELAKKAGLNNINIDLIYGLPYQNIELLKYDLEMIKKLDIQHISTYGLKIEKGCYFYENMPEKLPDDEIQADMYNFLCDYLSCFNHYEISNFCKDNYFSHHNLAYWLNKEYYGFGLNSSGYENNLRYKNTSNLKKYIQNPLLREEEIKLTKQEVLENEIFLRLRLKQGIDINEINKKFNIDFMKQYYNIIKKYSDLLAIGNDKIHLTRRGILLSNEIMSEFIDI